MDAIQLLTDDHDEVRDLFSRFDDAESPDEQEKIAERIFVELEVHTAIEEEIFYPAVREALPDLDELVAEGLEEHHVIDVLMQEVAALGRGDEEWKAKLTVMKENVEHHAGEEEDELFPQVRDGLDEGARRALGEQLARRKGALLLERLTLDDLRALAAENELEGISRLDKASLVETLAEAGVSAA